MRVRPLEGQDIPKIRAMFDRSGFDYLFPDLRGPKMESVLVVTDEDGEPMMACAAERITQLYLWFQKEVHPACRMAAIRLLHEKMAIELRKKGYDETNLYVPPKIERSFGKRLRSWGWTVNWPSFARRF